MSERYSRVFFLPENLYVETSPIILSAGSLLKDEQTGKVICQLKFKNIGIRRIAAVSVEIYPSNITGESLGDAVAFQYLDLQADRDVSFGEKEAIILPDNRTRSVDVLVREVVFSDKQVWQYQFDAPWQSLAHRRSIQDVLNDKELRKQYYLLYGQQAQYLYHEEKDLWYCVCGALNRRDEGSCHYCQRLREMMTPGVDMEALQKACDERLEKEAQEDAERRAEAAARLAELEAKRKLQRAKTKKIAKRITIVGIPLIIVGVIAWKMIGDYQDNIEHYKYAQKMMQSENYEGAVEKFEALGDFKDITTKLEEAKQALSEQQEQEKEDAYQRAIGCLEGGRSASAYNAFDELGDYKDSKDKKEEAYLQNRLDTFSESTGYFLSNKESYELIPQNQIASIIVGTWIVPASYSSSYSTMTFEADGTGVEDTDNEMAWQVDDRGLHYGFVYDGEQPNFEKDHTSEFRKIADGVYARFGNADDDDVDLFISADSAWAKRLETAYDVFLNNDNEGYVF